MLLKGPDDQALLLAVGEDRDHYTDNLMRPILRGTPVEISPPKLITALWRRTLFLTDSDHDQAVYTVKKRPGRGEIKDTVDKAVQEFKALYGRGN